MKTFALISPFLAFLVSTSSAFGFLIPRSLPNGRYRASYAANGTQIIEPLTAEVMIRDMNEVLAAGLVNKVKYVESVGGSLAARKRSDEKKRRLHCVCHQNMDHTDCDHATQEMRDLINEQPSREAYVPIGKGYFQTFDSVITHICTPPRNEGVTPVNVGTFDFALSFITERCGTYTPGAYIHGVTTGFKGHGMKGAAAYIGYNNEEVWDERHICQHMEDPKADHC